MMVGRPVFAYSCYNTTNSTILLVKEWPNTRTIRMYGGTPYEAQKGQNYSDNISYYVLFCVVSTIPTTGIYLLYDVTVHPRAARVTILSGNRNTNKNHSKTHRFFSQVLYLNAYG